MAGSAVLHLQDLELTFGGVPLIDGVTLIVERGERLCLLGRNGAGKSTLMQIAAGAVQADAGVVALSRGCHVAYLGQELPGELSGTALELACGTVRDLGAVGDLEVVDHEAESERRVAAERALTQLGIAHDAPVSTLSGGARRRVLLARALAAGADVLLLDEPTNHLDIQTVEWLEEYLKRVTTGGAREPAALVFVTHDRTFARNLATQVAELDRGKLYRFGCSYDEFLERRDELLASERAAWANFEKKLAEEEAWLRRGIRARRTRNEGRVKALMEMRSQFAARRERTGSARVGIHQGTRGSDLVIEAVGVAFGYGASGAANGAGRALRAEHSDGGAVQSVRVDPAKGGAARPAHGGGSASTSAAHQAPLLFQNLDTLILRGDRVGIVGPNGVGKTTLLRVLLGDLEPTRGTVRRGVGLEVVYFDQMRAALDETRTVFENVGDGYDTVRINGSVRHLNAYLEDFLFTPADAAKPVSVLSGGERNRVMLAKLLARPSNVLVLDEPTNDLDADTLDLLEEALAGYAGTVLLVSHDRSFLDNVVTDCLVLAGDGTVEEYVGGYSDWRERELVRRSRNASASASAETIGGGAASGRDERPKQRARRLSFKEARELEALPDRIAELEASVAELHDELADPSLYRSADAAERAKDLQTRLGVREREVESAYARWHELEELAAATEQ